MVDGAHGSMSCVCVALLYVYEVTCSVLRSTGGRQNQQPQRFSSWYAPVYVVLLGHFRGSHTSFLYVLPT
ncbi:hypothetical protein M404DRAFT_1008033, partial [Pisolithus tinctorius Marx 270]